MADTPEFLTLAETAELLRMTEHAVARLLKSGKLPAIYGGKREGWRVRRSDLATWTTNRPPQPKQPKDTD